MRVPTNSVTSNVLAQINKLTVQQARQQQEVSTGQHIFLPEDDPAAVGRLLHYSSESVRLQQYNRNISSALDLSQTTNSVLRQFQNLSDRAGEILSLGGGTLSNDGNQAYAKEVNQLIEQALQAGNLRFGTDHLFAGTAVDAPPFVATKDASGQITGITYQGNDGETPVSISETTTLSPRSSGTTNRALATFMNNLVALRDTLNVSAPMEVSRTALQASENSISNAISEQGAIQLRITLNKEQLVSRFENITKLISGEADADMATSIVKLNQTNTAYQAALSSSSKVLSMSLLDYLK